MYFNYESYQALIEMVGKEAEANAYMAEMRSKYISDCVKCMNLYVCAVNTSQTKIALAYATMEGEELRDTVGKADKEQHDAHETAIEKADGLNRQCATFGIDPIFSGSTKDRYQVADFAMEVAQTLFANRVS